MASFFRKIEELFAPTESEKAPTESEKAPTESEKAPTESKKAPTGLEKTFGYTLKQLFSLNIFNEKNIFKVNEIGDANVERVAFAILMLYDFYNNFFKSESSSARVDDSISSNWVMEDGNIVENGQIVVVPNIWNTHLSAFKRGFLKNYQFKCPLNYDFMSFKEENIKDFTSVVKIIKGAKDFVKQSDAAAIEEFSMESYAAMHVKPIKTEEQKAAETMVTILEHFIQRYNEQAKAVPTTKAVPTMKPF